MSHEVCPLRLAVRSRELINENCLTCFTFGRPVSDAVMIKIIKINKMIYIAPFAIRYIQKVLRRSVFSNVHVIVSKLC